MHYSYCYIIRHLHRTQAENCEGFHLHNDKREHIDQLSALLLYTFLFTLINTYERKQLRMPKLIFRDKMRERKALYA